MLIEMSLHGACAATHERQTRAPGSFSRLIANIRSMKALGLHMNLVSTLTVWNRTELDAMFTLADTLEVRLRFQGPVGPRDNGDLSPMRIQPSAAGWARLQELIAQRASAQSENAPSRPVKTSRLVQRQGEGQTVSLRGRQRRSSYRSLRKRISLSPSALANWQLA